MVKIVGHGCEGEDVACNCMRHLEVQYFLEGEKSAVFRLEQGVAQGCSLLPILFYIFINDLLKEVEQAKLGVQLM